MNDAYVQGFIDKCAEHGVDPEEMLKNAQALSQSYLPSVYSNPATAMWGSAPVDNVRGFSPHANAPNIRQVTQAGALGTGLMPRAATPSTPPAQPPSAFSKFKNLLTAPTRMGVAAGQRMRGQ